MKLTTTLAACAALIGSAAVAAEGLICKTEPVERFNVSGESIGAEPYLFSFIGERLLTSSYENSFPCFMYGDGTITCHVTGSAGGILYQLNPERTEIIHAQIEDQYASATVHSVTCQLQ